MGLDLFHVVLTATPQLEHFTIDDFTAAPEFEHTHSHLFFEVDDADRGKTRAVFWQTIGFQRKGMTVDFKKQFENGKLYFDVASVNKAARYIELSVDRPELPDSFIADFIDNFIEGESIFMASW